MDRVIVLDFCCAWRPDEAAETEGTISGSAVVEQLLTRLPTDEATEGVVEL